MIPIRLSNAPVKDPESTNVFLLEGDLLTLVDTGFRTEAAWDSLNAQLAEHGYQVEEIKQIILTHAHPDHYGLAARIQRHNGAEVLSHRDCASRFLYDNPDWQRDNQFLLETLIATGAPEPALRKRLTYKKGGDPLVDPIQVSRFLEDGDQVISGEENWDVFVLPGHAPGVIGLYRRETGELITSDHLLPETNSRPGLYPTPCRDERDCSFMGNYLSSMEKIALLEPAKIWPSHGEMVTNVNELVSYWIEKHQRRAQEIAIPLETGDKTAYQIWKDHFPKILPFDPVKGLVEVITYLDLYLSQGKVDTYSKGKFVYYRLNR
jgi:glyoxylase-like metal-dependent hydrolase (beta-lactamase superfamily II)